MSSTLEFLPAPDLEVVLRVTRLTLEFGRHLRMTLHARNAPKSDVDDVTQETWMKIWRAAMRGKIPSFIYSSF
jgi:DNA-directed RNA polymerase specialized sigma24 family protein